MKKKASVLRKPSVYGCARDEKTGRKKKEIWGILLQNSMLYPHTERPMLEVAEMIEFIKDFCQLVLRKVSLTAQSLRSMTSTWTGVVSRAAEGVESSLESLGSDTLFGSRLSAFGSHDPSSCTMMARV